MQTLVTLLISVSFVIDVAVILAYSKEAERNGIHATLCILAAIQIVINIFAILALMAGKMIIVLIGFEPQ